MDSSITTGCYALSNAIAKTSLSLGAFVRDVRESRSEVDALSGGLHSLDGVLDLLKEDASSFPAALAARTPTVLQHCNALINELEGYTTVLNSSELSTQAKKLRWAATRSHMAKLRLALDGYKSALGLAVDLVAFTSAAAKESGRESPTEASNASQNISKTVEEMGRLSTRLQGDFQKNAALRSYLDALQLYADTTTAGNSPGEPDRAASSTKSLSDAPDSAIEMGDDPPFKTAPSSPAGDPPALASQDMDELLDELKEMPSNRPPTPPPRNMRRSLSARSAAPPSIARERPPLILRPTNVTFVTTISAGGSDAADPPPPVKRGLLGRMFGSTRKRSFSSSSSSSAAASTATADYSPRPSSAASVPPSISTPGDRPGSSLVRRASSGGRRMSLKALPMFKSLAEEAAPPVPAADSEPNAVFGVSLQKSLQVAYGSARTRHSAAAAGGREGGATSHRAFPLCVHKCVQFVASGTEAGVAVPDIFGEGTADPPRLAALRRLFGEGPAYGEDVDWSWFTPYDAADLVLLFLSELPKPLVPEPVARRWVSLSRQATVSNGSRTDQCLDFWEEALLGVRGPARNLLKLLLNLWADVAEAADFNGMTAERLAARVVQPLMHTSARAYTTDYMLGLAFLIRKRCEYLALMQGNKGKAKAAF